jgi:tripartite-type tricarboxylate transporter receptor subunit TctC
MASKNKIMGNVMWPAEAHFGRRRLLAATVVLAPIAARAQDTGDWPNRPVRLVVPFPPGGPTDIIARLYAQALGPVLKQTVVVENRAGGSGVTGTDYVLKSVADGYTFGIIDGGSLTILPHTQPKMPYRVPEALVAHPSLGVKSLPELLELAKRQPGRLNIGTAGAAGISHLTALVFRAQTGAAVEVVPYRGAAPAVTDLVAGQVQLLFADLPPLLPHIKAGSMTTLALAARGRSPSLPDVPTTGEFGFPKLLAENWYCAVAPRGLPAPVTARISAALKAASQAPGVKNELAAQGAEAAWTSPEEMLTLMREDSESWRQVVVTSGVKSE